MNRPNVVPLTGTAIVGNQKGYYMGMFIAGNLERRLSPILSTVGDVAKWAEAQTILGKYEEPVVVR